jgi:hypothetical protein
LKNADNVFDAVRPIKRKSASRFEKRRATPQSLLPCRKPAPKNNVSTIEEMKQFSFDTEDGKTNSTSTLAWLICKAQAREANSNLVRKSLSLSLEPPLQVQEQSPSHY